jgi:hypothetical protein
MKILARFAFSTDDVPDGALEDALGLAALCLMILVGFAATSLT